MANDEMQNLWSDQPLEPVRILAAELKRKAELLDRKTRVGLRLAIAIMIFCAIGYASFLHFFPGTIQRIGAALTLAGYAYGFYVLYTRGPARKVPAGPALATCVAYRAELVRHRDFHRIAWRTMILPFVPGPAIFIMGFLIPEQGLANALAITAALIASPFAAGVPLNRMKAKKLQEEIDQLDTLMKGL